MADWNPPFSSIISNTKTANCCTSGRGYAWLSRQLQRHFFARTLQFRERWSTLRRSAQASVEDSSGRHQPPKQGRGERLLTVPGIDVARCAAGQSPFALACAHGRVDAMEFLLHTGRVDISFSGSGDLPICQAAERGQQKAVRLLDQQGRHLQINRKPMTTYDTALCIAVRDGSPDLIQALLRHDQIDPNLENRWCQASLSLAAQRAHLHMVYVFLADARLSRCSMFAALDFVASDSRRFYLEGDSNQDR